MALVTDKAKEAFANPELLAALFGDMQPVTVAA